MSVPAVPPLRALLDLLEAGGGPPPPPPWWARAVPEDMRGFYYVLLMFGAALLQARVQKEESVTEQRNDAAARAPAQPLDKPSPFPTAPPVPPRFQTLCIAQYFHYGFLAGMRARAAVVAACYRKVLALSPAARGKVHSGEVMTFVSADAKRVQDSAPYIQARSAGNILSCLSITPKSLSNHCPIISESSPQSSLNRR